MSKPKVLLPNQIEINRIKVHLNKNLRDNDTSVSFRIKYSYPFKSTKSVKKRDSEGNAIKNEKDEYEYETVEVVQDEEIPFQVQAPKMYSRYGVSNNETSPHRNPNDPLKWSVMASLNGDNQKVKEFKSKWKKIENHVLKQIVKNGWYELLSSSTFEDDDDEDDVTPELREKLKKQKERTDPDALIKQKVRDLKQKYYSQIKTNKGKNDGKEYSNFKIPISFKNGVPNNVAFWTNDSPPQPASYKDVTEHSNVICIFHYNTLLAPNDKMLCNSVKLKQLQFFPPVKQTVEFDNTQCYIHDSDSEADDDTQCQPDGGEIPDKLDVGDGY